MNNTDMLKKWCEVSLEQEENSNTPVRMLYSKFLEDLPTTEEESKASYLGHLAFEDFAKRLKTLYTTHRCRNADKYKICSRIKDYKLKN